ncbi:MAG TPA: hypothetical protein VMF31_03775 [Solirubrobacterales bacterium]|nr:hypothetical protein [Solirubrobacterales bacterium]
MILIAMGPVPAQAGTGNLNAPGGRCDVTFTTGAQTAEGPDAGAGFVDYRDLTNIAVDPAMGKSCVFAAIAGEFHVHWKADGSAQAIGNLTIPTALAGACSYSGTINGIAAPTGFTMTTTPTALAKTAGGFLCPATFNLVNLFGNMSHFTF